MTAADIVRGVSSGVSAGSVSFSTFAVTTPAGVVSGDQLALFIDTRDAYASWTPPAGWVQRARPAESSGEGIYYTAKYGTDVTGTSWTFSTGAAAASGKWGWILVALKGDRVGDYVTGAAQAQASAGTSSPSPSISPAVPVHMVALAGDRITGGSTWTWPSGWVEQADQQDSTGTNAISQTAAVYDTTPATAGTYSVTPVHSTTGSIAWSGILAFADQALISVAAALSGSGSLTAASVPAVTQVAALGGSGTLSTSQTAAVTRAAALSGSGTLSATSAPSVTRTAALAGGGTLTATQSAAVTRTAALSGSGTLSATPIPGVTTAASLTGTGTLAATTNAAQTATANLTGSGTLTATTDGAGPDTFHPHTYVSATLTDGGGLVILGSNGSGIATLAGTGLSEAVLAASLSVAELAGHLSTATLTDDAALATLQTTT